MTKEKLQAEQARSLALEGQVEARTRCLRSSRAAFSRAMAALPAAVAEAHPSVSGADDGDCSSAFSRLVQAVAKGDTEVGEGTQEECSAQEAIPALVAGSPGSREWQPWMRAVAASHNHMELLAEVMQM